MSPRHTYLAMLPISRNLLRMESRASMFPCTSEKMAMRSREPRQTLVGPGQGRNETTPDATFSEHLSPLLPLFDLGSPRRRTTLDQCKPQPQRDLGEALVELCALLFGHFTRGP